jgi:elongation factor 1 alpha-like protein
MSADVEITLRVTGMSDPNSKARALPLEVFAANKDMGRILVRRGGETIAAGKLHSTRKVTRRSYESRGRVGDQRMNGIPETLVT